MVKQRATDYATTAAGNAWESTGYTWGIFFQCYIIASLLNPYFWKLFSDGHIGLNLWGLFFYSIIFAIVVAGISTIPAFYYNFNYNDINCYKHEFKHWYQLLAFWTWPIMPWNWGTTGQDQECEKRREIFGTISTAVGVLVIMLYYIYDYGMVYGNYKFPLGKLFSRNNKTIM